MDKVIPEMAKISVQRSTVAPLIEAWEALAKKAGPQEAQAIRMRIAQFQNAVNSHGGASLAATLDAPSGAMSNVSEEMYNLTGGPQGEVKAQQGVITQAQRDIIGPARVDLENAVRKRDFISYEIEDSLKKDPTFGPLLNELGVAVDTKHYSSASASGCSQAATAQVVGAGISD
jgi:hypothetical protein